MSRDTLDAEQPAKCFGEMTLGRLACYRYIPIVIHLDMMPTISFLVAAYILNYSLKDYVRPW
jgi:hypothetical protein